MSCQPHLVKSVAACRYLEILSSQTRDLGDDLKEYCRRFELCSDLVSEEHVNMEKLTTMFMKGLPARYHNVQGSYVPFYRAASFHDTLKNAKNGIWENQLGLATIDRSTRVDRLLKTFQIKNHPKADFEDNDNFDRFMDMITSSTHEQLLEALYPHAPELEMASDVESMTSSDSSDQVKTPIYTPSVSSQGEPDAKPKTNTKALSHDEFKTLATKFGYILIKSLPDAVGEGQRNTVYADTQRLFEAVGAHVRQRRKNQEYDAFW
jgi:hypothetical protein